MVGQVAAPSRVTEFCRVFNRIDHCSLQTVASMKALCGTMSACTAAKRLPAEPLCHGKRVVHKPVTSSKFAVALHDPQSSAFEGAAQHM